MSNNSTRDPFGILSTHKDYYGDYHSAHYFEQYKLYVEMADRISARRMLANTFFLTAHTAIIAAMSAFYKDIHGPKLWMLFPLIAVIILCFVWWRLVQSYRQLNSGKYKVIGEMEKFLPAKPYAAEWIALGKGENPKLYRPLTHVENWVPLLFIVIYIGLGLLFYFKNDITLFA